jgi:mannose/fructose/N-acetylgalactosamine-specific phosphotransferase system component IIB
MTVRVRVDDRLLHTEVLYGCLEVLPVKHLVVASRLPAVASVDAGVLPEGVRLSVVGPDRVADCLVEGEDTLVVVGTPTDLAEALENGLRPGPVRLANRARRPETLDVSPSFRIDREELEALRRAVAKGCTVGAQRVCSEPVAPIDLDLLASLFEHRWPTKKP